MKNQFRKIYAVYIIVLFVVISFCASQAEARSGCCSHHSGVCGCRCCDGTSLSAKCAPYYPSCSPAKPVVIPPVVIPKVTLPQNDIPVKEFKQDEEEIKKEEIDSWLPKNEPSVLGKSQAAEIQGSNETEKASLENTDNFPLATLIFLIAAGGFGYWVFKK